MTNSVFAQVDSGLRGVGLDLARDNLPVIFTEVLLRPIPLCLTISLPAAVAGTAAGLPPLEAVGLPPPPPPPLYRL